VAGGLSRRQIVVLAALAAFGPLSLDSYLPGLPSLTRDLHATASAGQLTITACMLGLGVGQLIAGPLSDARGRRGTLLTGIVAYSVASAACALAPSVAFLVIARLVEGMAGGFGIVIGRAIVRDLTGGVTAARTFALLMGIGGVVPVCAPLIGGQLLLVTSWRGVFILLAALGIPLVIATAAILPETLELTDRHTGGLRSTVGTFGGLVRDRSYSPYALAFALSFASMFAYIAGSSFVLEDIYGISPQLFSLIFAANSAGLIALSLVSGRLVEHIGPARLLRRGLYGTFLSSMCALVVVLAHAPLGLLLASFFVLLAANGIVLPNGTAAAMGGARRSLGAASALLGLSQFGLGALVAPLVGLAGSHDAVPMAIVIAGAGAAALAVDVLFAPRIARVVPEPG
jgi:DHA1 family bicyclomycin/chloramphenicol resistance-like MFS transporter